MNNINEFDLRQKIKDLEEENTFLKQKINNIEASLSGGGGNL